MHGKDTIPSIPGTWQIISPTPQIINEKGGSALKNKGAGEMIEETAENLMKKGVPARTAAYASSMGYLRQLKKK